MKNFRSAFSIYLTIGLLVFGAFAQANRPQNAAPNEPEVRDIVKRVNSKVSDFRKSFDSEMRRSSSVNRDAENEINDGLRNLEDGLRNFDNKFQSRRETGADVEDILRSAKYINETLNLNQINSNKVQSNWSEIRGLLDRLASDYQVSSNWGNQNDTDPNYSSNDNRAYPNDNKRGSMRRNYPQQPLPPRAVDYSTNSLTGTYKLDVSKSEDTREVVDRAIAAGDSSDAKTDLQNKLETPDQIIIEVRGNQVTIASSRAPQITFTADGQDRTDSSSAAVGGSGKSAHVRATLRGQELTVASLGSGNNDYTVIFTSIDNGSAMRVMRRVTTDYLPETVFIESVYQKTDAVARFENGANSAGDSNGDYSSNDPQDNRSNQPNGNYPSTTTARTGTFVVPDGTILTGTLDNDIDASISQNNDRFRMIVQAPNEYRGAVIEGYLSGINRSGRVSGRSQMTFNFERITLANGQNYDFAGFLQSVTDENGKTVKVDTEGTARANSQTKETVKRGGIGAGLGAIIGAVVGGPGGAAIGAVIGGGAGAGSVVLQGKDDLKLRKGSSITVQSSSPIR